MLRRAGVRGARTATALTKVDPRPRAAAGLPRHARHAGHDRLLRPARRRQAAAGARRSSSPARPARSAPSSGRSRRSRAAARSASPAARRSAAASSTSSASTPAIDYKSRGRPTRRCGSTAPTASTSTSTTSAARSSTPRCARLARGARVVICGASPSTTRPTGMQRPDELHVAARQPREHDRLRRVRLRRPLRRGGARDGAAGWPPGKLKSREDVVEGLERFPDALLELFRGENLGKLVLKVG